MRNLISARAFSLVVALALAGPAAAQQAEIAETIQRQMDAFLAEDESAAFGFASPGIQGLFGTPENFGRMVRDGYPMVWSPGDVRFGKLAERGGLWVQNVYVSDAAGAPHLLEYTMEQIDGRWCIAGVRILEMPEAAV